MLCEYGCGKEAKYQFKNGRWCCQPHYLKCSVNKEKRCGTGNPFYNKIHTDENKEIIRNTLIGRKPPCFKSLENNTKIYCKFGCGNLAKFISVRGEYYCSNNSSKCPEIKKVNKSKNIGSENSKRQKFKKIDFDNDKLCEYGCGKIAEYINKNGKLCCSEYTTQCINRNTKYTIEEYKQKYFLFSNMEEMRYNPDKPEEKEIQVHCKYNECQNSKEQGGWFTPSKSQLYERCRSIEKFNVDHSYFYCSNECKNECPLYRKRGADPFKKIDLPYTSQELNVWKQTVLEQDNHECQKCGEKENLQCHHINPVKTHPHLVLDPTNGIVFCEKCHYEIGHKTGTKCSTGNLANKQQNGCKLGN